VLSILFITGGLALSYGPNLPSGATTISLAGATYILVLVGRFLFSRSNPG
jgi:zinc transport system permease protein